MKLNKQIKQSKPSLSQKLKYRLQGIILTLFVLIPTTIFATTQSTQFIQQIQTYINQSAIFLNSQPTNIPTLTYNNTVYAPVDQLSSILLTPYTITQSSHDPLTNQIILSQPNTYLTTVTRVIDGDTFEVNYNNTTEKIRLIGIDTPESVHPDVSKNTESGITSSDFTKSQLLNKKIVLEFDVQERDQYGRLLAYAYLDGKMYNKTLLEEGYAKIATFPPNIKYVEDFKIIEQQAKSQNKGLWSLSEVSTQSTEPTNTIQSNSINSTESTSQSNQQSSGGYIGSTNSNKYHYLDCRWAEKINTENAIYFDSIEDAESQGYEPCGVCKPN